MNPLDARSGLEIEIADIASRKQRRNGMEKGIKTADMVVLQLETLRDKFAMVALHGLLAFGEHRTDGAEPTAIGAYEIADAMLKAREE